MAPTNRQGATRPTEPAMLPFRDVDRYDVVVADPDSKLADPAE